MYTSLKFPLAIYIHVYGNVHLLLQSLFEMSLKCKVVYDILKSDIRFVQNLRSMNVTCAEYLKLNLVPNKRVFLSFTNVYTLANEGSTQQNPHYFVVKI